MTRSTSDPLNVKIKRYNHDYRKYFFSIRAAAAWNGIPTSLKQAPKKSIFKNGLKKLISEGRVVVD